MKRYLPGGGLWTYHFNSGGTQTSVDKQYIYKDALGSVTVITDGVGTVKQQLAYNAWGQRVNNTDWKTVLPSTTFLPVSQQFTTRGYTGQDMLDAVGLIHYGGRIYDARIGRFVQADPVVQDGEDLQAYNRYAYVRNNPLTLTDPSGFSWFTKHLNPFKALSDDWKRIKPYAQMIAVAVVAFYCIPCAAALNAAWTVANGGTLMQGLIAGVSTMAFSYMPGGGTFADLSARQIATNILAGGMVGGVMSVMQGGKFGNGFISAGIGAAVGMTGIQNPAAQFAVASIAGGTASVLTGGKFANGAVSGAIGFAVGYAVNKMGAAMQRWSAQRDFANMDPNANTGVMEMDDSGNPSGTWRAANADEQGMLAGNDNAIGDFRRNYDDMIDANTIGADKYFHCKANCEASSRGFLGRGTANVIGAGREATDLMRPSKWYDAYRNTGSVGGAAGYMIQDMSGDLNANAVGRGVQSGQKCQAVCGQFRPKGLNSNY
jgi:RHS repeat-associated protein